MAAAMAGQPASEANGNLLGSWQPLLDRCPSREVEQVFTRVFQAHRQGGPELVSSSISPDATTLVVSGSGDGAAKWQLAIVRLDRPDAAPKTVKRFRAGDQAIAPTTYVWSPGSSLWIAVQIDGPEPLSQHKKWLEYSVLDGEWTEASQKWLTALATKGTDALPEYYQHAPAPGDNAPPVWTPEGRHLASAREGRRLGFNVLWTPPDFAGDDQMAFYPDREGRLHRIMIEAPPVNKDPRGRSVATAYMIVEQEIVGRMTLAGTKHPLPVIFAYENDDLVAYHLPERFGLDATAWHTELPGVTIENLYKLPAQLWGPIGRAVVVVNTANNVEAYVLTGLKTTTATKP